jgi:nitroreductase
MLRTMEFQDVVRRRKMVRDYATDPVDPGIVERALHNAVRAPNAGFSQGWGFLVLDEPADVGRFWEVTTDADDLAAPDGWLTGMMHAPVLVLPCSSKAAYLKRYAQEDKGWTDEDETRWAVPFWHIDTGMAALLILQTVTDAGLGACYFGVPPDRVEAVRQTFAIPATFDPIGAITIGHRTTNDGLPGSPSVRPRRPQEDVVHRGRWASSTS